MKNNITTRHTGSYRYPASHDETAEEQLAIILEEQGFKVELYEATGGNSNEVHKRISKIDDASVDISSSGSYLTIKASGVYGRRYNKPAEARVIVAKNINLTKLAKNIKAVVKSKKDSEASAVKAKDARERFTAIIKWFESYSDTWMVHLESISSYLDYNVIKIRRKDEGVEYEWKVTLFTIQLINGIMDVSSVSMPYDLRDVKVLGFKQVELLEAHIAFMKEQRIALQPLLAELKQFTETL